MKDKSKQILSESEKRELRRQIMLSAADIKKKKQQSTYKLNRRIGYGVAASLVAAIGLFFFLKQPAEPSLQDYVLSAPVTDPASSNEVTIILGSEQVNISKDNSNIQYSATGDNVKIGDEKVVNQKAVENNEAIFNTLIVPYGKRTSLTLSDGTKIWMNSGSKLVYPAIFKGNTREVFLEGEAIFDVAHNKKVPFKVLSKNQEIEVLGTVFNVSAYANEEEQSTVLKEGSVQITYNESKKTSMRLAPGMMSMFNAETDKMSSKRVNPDDYFSWRDGFLTLHNRRLDFIAKKLSRYYNIPIEVNGEGIAEKTFSGNLDLKDDVEHVIKVFNETSGLTYERTGNKILITN